MSDFRSINNLMFLTHVSVYRFFTAYSRFSHAEQVIVFLYGSDATQGSDVLQSNLGIFAKNASSSLPLPSMS